MFPISHRSLTPNCLNVEAKTAKYTFAELWPPPPLYLCPGPDTGCNCTKSKELGQQFLHAPPQRGLKTQPILFTEPTTDFLRFRPKKWLTWPESDKRLLKLGVDRDSIVLRKGASEDHLNSGLEILQKGSSETGKDTRGPKGKGDARRKEVSEWTAEGAAGDRVSRSSRSQCPKDCRPNPSRGYTMRSRRQGRQQGPGRLQGQHPASLLLTECAGAPPLASAFTARPRKSIPTMQSGAGRSQGEL